MEPKDEGDFNFSFKGGISMLRGIEWAEIDIDKLHSMFGRRNDWEIEWVEASGSTCEKQNFESFEELGGRRK